METESLSLTTTTPHHSNQKSVTTQLSLINSPRSDANGNDEEGDESFLYFGFGSNLLSTRIHINAPSATLVGVGRLRGHQLGFAGFSEAWQGGVASIFQSQECGDAEVNPGVEAQGIPPCNPLVGVSYEDDETGERRVCMWGAVWRISKAHLACLDEQEGVSQGVYHPIHVTVDLFDSFVVDPLRDCWYGPMCDTDGDHGIHSDQVVLKELIRSIQFRALTQGDCGQRPLRATLDVRAYKKARDKAVAPDSIPLSLPSDSYLLVLLKGALESGLPLPYVTALASLATNHQQSVFRDWQKKN